MRPYVGGARGKRAGLLDRSWIILSQPVFALFCMW